MLHIPLIDVFFYFEHIENTYLYDFYISYSSSKKSNF